MLHGTVDKGSRQAKSGLARLFPFNAEQTVNILSEFGPLVTLFIVNAVAGIEAGTWALLISTVVAMIAMRLVVGRLPVFPVIASAVTVAFGALTLLTGDPMWVQIKVTIFNAMFAGFLFGGLASPAGSADVTKRGRALSSMLLIQAAGVIWLASDLATAQPISNISVLWSELVKSGDVVVPRAWPTNAMSVASVLVGYIVGRYLFARNFFKYSFEKTFHYTDEGWGQFTFNFAWFFVLTAVLNELVRQMFVDTQTYSVLGFKMDGISIWIAFKIAIIMPLSGLFAWYLTRILQKHRIDEPHGAEDGHPGSARSPLGEGGSEQIVLAKFGSPPGQQPPLGPMGRVRAAE